MAYRNVRFVDVVIAINTAVSGAFDFNGQQVVGIVVPSAWTAADLSFEVEVNSANIKVVDKAGALYKLTGVATTASEYRLLSGSVDQSHVVITGPGDGFIVSTNTGSEADINQTAARTLTVVLADV